jgi:hypothetical protein
MSSSNPLAAAKSAAESANKFTQSVDKQAGHPYASAPYSMAHEKRVKSGAAPAQVAAGLGKEVSDIAGGIKYRAEQAKALDQ